MELHWTDALHGRGIPTEIKKCKSIFPRRVVTYHTDLSLFAGVRNDFYERVRTRFSLSPPCHESSVHLSI